MEKSLLRITLGSIVVATFLTSVSNCIDAESNLKEDITKIETQTETNNENVSIIIGRNSYKNKTETSTIITTITEVKSETTTINNDNDELLQIIDSNAQDGWCYTESELMLLAKLIDLEASDLCTDEHKLWVGQVVLNRILSDKFPDTLVDVIYQKGQYECKNKIDSYTPSERSIEMAQKLLNGYRVCDEDVVFQSEFTQGKQVVKTIDVYINGRYYSTTYFCK